MSEQSKAGGKFFNIPGVESQIRSVLGTFATNIRQIANEIDSTINTEKYAKKVPQVQQVKKDK